MKQSIFKYRKTLLQRKFYLNTFFLALSLSYWSFASNTFQFWGDYVVAFAMLIFLYKVIHSTIQLIRPLPKVIISSLGVQDPYFGNILVPWSAIEKIKVAKLNNDYGGSIFIFADARQLKQFEMPIWHRIAHFLTSFFKNQPKDTILCVMTPVVALEASMSDILQNLQSFGKEIELEIV